MVMRFNTWLDGDKNYVFANRLVSLSNNLFQIDVNGMWIKYQTKHFEDCLPLDISYE